MARRLFESRSQAQAAIAAGLVRVDGEPVTNPARAVRPDSTIEASPAHPWASRGGVKLAAALDSFAIDPTGRICLDIGASTGGFTDVLLTRGARHVHAVDVGRDQFHPRLRSDPRVSLREGFDARRISGADFDSPPSLIVVDVSFISLAKALPAALDAAATDAVLVALVKPQFEVGPKGVERGGIVRDPALRASAVADVITWLSGMGWTTRGTIASPIAGGDGNEEFLIAADRARSPDD